ncbi:FAD-dependent oxidoreductase [bacterium]|nr:FAD-dependent oxidoreductase [bacterium]
MDGETDDLPARQDNQVVVLGAGLAGLGFARAWPGTLVFEAKPHPGGRAWSIDIEGVFFDQGTHISHSRNDSFNDMIRQAAGKVVETEKAQVSNFWKGSWLPYPVQNHLHALPLEDRVQALADLIQARINHSDVEPPDYGAWCRGQYGEFLADRFYRVFTEKYWRAPMENLATDWLAGRLLPPDLTTVIRGALSEASEEQAHFSRFRYPERGGYFGFFESLYPKLGVQHNETAVELDLAKKEILFDSGRRQDYDILASSIPLPDLVEAVKDAPTSVREAAARLSWTKLLCVNLLIERKSLSDLHWFYTYDPDQHTARAYLPRNLSPGMVAEGITALQAEVFRRNDEPWDPESLAEEMIDQMASLLRFSAKRDLRVASPVVVRYAYVVSDHARAAAVAHILAWLRERDVFCMGLYGKWKYVWSDYAYLSGVETAAEVRERLCRT